MDAAESDLGRVRRKVLLIASAVGIALALLVFAPIRICPDCRGTGAWRADPMFVGQCSGCGGKGKRSLWGLVIHPPIQQSMPERS